MKLHFLPSPLSLRPSDHRVQRGGKLIQFLLCRNRRERRGERVRHRNGEKERPSETDVEKTGMARGTADASPIYWEQNLGSAITFNDMSTRADFIMLEPSKTRLYLGLRNLQQRRIWGVCGGGGDGGRQACE